MKALRRLALLLAALLALPWAALAEDEYWDAYASIIGCTNKIYEIEKNVIKPDSTSVWTEVPFLSNENN